MKYAFLVVAILISSWANAQVVISGTITSDNGKAIPSASVFLSNTSKGTVTDDKGQFTLKDVPAGRQTLVVTCIGFETVYQLLDSGDLSRLRVTMHPEASELGEVEIRAYDKNGYQKWGDVFEAAFIGTSGFARQCVIKNPKDIRLHFGEKSQVLTAYSDRLIIIENHALGYQLRVMLKFFRYELGTQAISFGLYPFFSEMTGSPAEMERWRKARSKAYYGSPMHFFRALYQGRVEDEGFRVQFESYKDSSLYKQIKLNVKYALAQAKIAAGTSSAQALPETLIDPSLLSLSMSGLKRIRTSEDRLINPAPAPADGLIAGRDSDFIVLWFPQPVKVTYLPGTGLEGYDADTDQPDSGGGANTQSGKAGSKTSSNVELVHGFPTQVYANGSMVNSDVLWDGYWLWLGKLSNMLPYEYEPGPFAPPGAVRQ